MRSRDSRSQDDSDDVGYDLSKSEHIEEIRAEAMDHLRRFFMKKPYWAGGRIPKRLIDSHIDVVMTMRMADALAIAHYCLKKNPPDTVDTCKPDWDIELVYSFLTECKNSGTPKCHAGGMLLAYISLCHGVDFLPTLRNINEVREQFIKNLEDVQEDDD